MPPFLTGLLKRKIDTKNTNDDSSKTFSDNETAESEESDVLLPEELNLEGDDTDSEDDAAAESDQEPDAAAAGEEPRGGSASDESSDLEDSEADEGSDEEEDGSEREDASGGDDGSDDEVVEAPRPRRAGAEAASQRASASVDKLAEALADAAVAPQPVAQRDEYSSGDTSDEEDRRNTAGDVPAWWYDEYPHAGYDLDGRRLLKPARRDRVDEFLRRCSDPEFWRTVRDPATGQDVVLSAADLQLLARLRDGAAPAPDAPEPWSEWFSREPLAAPLRAFPDHKRSFLPSRDERRRVARLVHALRMGWLQTRKQLARERARRKRKAFYDLWGSRAGDEAAPRGARPIPAPRRALPAHAESYNPPPEYLLDAAEMKEWAALAETPWKRKYSFLPTAHASLRHVPAYERFARERFLRCLDLYLAPRAVKMRLTIRADDLVPRLPAPRDLRPFPTAEALAFRGHAGLVRAVDFDPSGQYAVSGGDDGTVRVWETGSGRCLRTLEAGAPVAAVAWCPARGLSLVAAAAGARLLLLNPGAAVGAHRTAARTDELLREAPAARATPDARTAAAAAWDAVAPDEWARGLRLAVSHFRPVTHAAWHARGDYLCVTLRDAASRAVLVHQLSRRRSQLPFSRAKGLVQCALFHPSKPLLFVATQRAVRVYDLVKQELTRKLLPGAQWVSCMAVHPSGDHLLVGSYDRKLAWFDLELSAEPYRSLRLHGGAVRAVAFHRRYPLFASGGDDRDAVVSHGAVFGDLLQNPLLVPLKALRAGARRDALCVLALAWHPTQPWLLLAGADGVLRLYS